MTNSPGPGRIQTRYSNASSNLTQILDRARLCAALTKPWILPPLHHNPDFKLPESYQSVGSRGVTNLVGKMLAAIFPPGLPWFQFALAPEIEFNPNIDPEKKQEWLDALFLQELIVSASIDASHLDGKKNRNRRPCGFRSRKNVSLAQLIVTGDVLEQLTDDFRLKVFRRDQYITKRDSSGDVLFHIIKESIDPLSALTEKQREMASLDEKNLAEKFPDERSTDMYTLVEWQPLTNQWKICQEVNGYEINESIEPISPFFSTPFDLTGGEDYGRGLIESNLGDLRALNNLEERLLDFAAMCSRLLLAVDGSSEADDEDLRRPSGSITRGLRVTNGMIQDAAFLKVDKYPDFKVVQESAQRKRADLGMAMLIESETAPTGEAGRSPVAWNRIASQLDGALGGMYAPIADDQQIPFVRRAVHVLRLQNKLPKLPEEAVNISVLTGLAAMARELKLGKVMSLADMMMKLGPEVARRLDDRVLIDVYQRYSGLYEAGLVKSDEKMQQETQQAIATQTQAATAEKTVDVMGNVVQQQLTPTT